MKKIAMSLFTLFAMVAVVAGGTWAVWSDTSTVAGNTITTGTISIDARPVSNKPINVTGLLPGESTTGTVDLLNDGTREQRQYMHVVNRQGSLCGYIDLEVGYSWGGVNEMNVSLYSGPLSDFAGIGNIKEVGRGSENPGGGIIAGSATTSYPTGDTTRLVQIATVRENAPNSLQGETCTWDEVFTGEQVVTP